MTASNREVPFFWKFGGGYRHKAIAFHVTQTILNSTYGLFIFQNDAFNVLFLTICDLDIEGFKIARRHDLIIDLTEILFMKQH